MSDQWETFCDVACETLLNDKPRDITESLYKAGDALAAWKGGSDE